MLGFSDPDSNPSFTRRRSSFFNRGAATQDVGTWISCKHEDALSDARVLSAELSKATRKHGLIGGVTGADARAIQNADALVLLLTEGVLWDARCLHEAYEALLHGVPLISICVADRGYDFAKAKAHLKELVQEQHHHTSLLGDLGALMTHLPGHDELLPQQLLSALPNIISLHWQPERGPQHLKGVIKAIRNRMSMSTTSTRVRIEPTTTAPEDRQGAPSKLGGAGLFVRAGAKSVALTVATRHSASDSTRSNDPASSSDAQEKPPRPTHDSHV